MLNYVADCMEFLEVSNISMSFQNNKVFENFSYKFSPGVTIIKGKNGIGKSTLLSILSNTTRPDSGTIKCCIDGQNEPFKIIEHGNFVPDKPDFYDFITTKEFLKLMNNLKGVPFDLEESVLFDEFKLQKHLYTPFDALSIGTKKKVFLLVALISPAPVIILDEPTNSLDDESNTVLIKHIKRNVQAGAIIIMSSHDTNFTNTFNANIIDL